MSLSVLGDFFENLFDPNRGLPLPLTLCHRRIQHHPRNVIRARRRLTPDGMLFETSGAPGAKLSERHSRGNTTANVLDSLGMSVSRFHLLEHKRCYIAGMQAVAHLMPSPVVANILERPPS